MILSGYTDDRLSEIKTYEENNPYQVGYNGVTQITTDNGGNVDSVEYIIDNIRYITNIGKAFFPNNNEKFSSETIYFFESSGLSEEKINLIKKVVNPNVLKN